MQLDDPLAARVLVQAVCVLGDDGEQPADRFELRQGDVARVGLGRECDPTPVARHLPIRLGIGHETVDRRDLDRVVLGPEPALAAERRDPAFGRHARTRQRDGVPRPDQELCRSLDHQTKTD